MFTNWYPNGTTQILQFSHVNYKVKKVVTIKNIVGSQRSAKSKKLQVFWSQLLGLEEEASLWTCYHIQITRLDSLRLFLWVYLIEIVSSQKMKTDEDVKRPIKGEMLSVPRESFWTLYTTRNNNFFCKFQSKLSRVNEIHKYSSLKGIAILCDKSNRT